MTALRADEPELTEQAQAADPAAGRWSADQMLLAALTDSVRQLVWMFATVNFKSAPKSPPEPIPRPGITPKRRKSMTVAQYRAMTGEAPPLHLVQDAPA